MKSYKKQAHLQQCLSWWPFPRVSNESHLYKAMETCRPVDRGSLQHMNIRGTIISVMTCYIGSQATHHLVLSFSFGGWKLLLDININALKHRFSATGLNYQLSTCGVWMSKCREQAVKMLYNTLLCLPFLWCHVQIIKSVCADSPHWMEVIHWWLELSQLNGCNADSPDVTQVVIAPFLLHCSHLWGHPEWSNTDKLKTLIYCLI